MSVSQPAGAIRTLATGSFNDQILSPDGAILYVSTGSRIKAYTVADGTQIGDWAVGSQLGGIDVSPNGRYIVATEWQNGPTVNTGPNTWTTEFYVKVLDIVTGAVSTYTSLEGPYQSYFYDASYMADGRILLTQQTVGSGSQPLTVLDPATGTFTEGNVLWAQAGVMAATPDRSTILITGKNNSGGPTLLYESGVGVVAERGFSTNTGVQSISNDGAMVAEDRQILNDQLQVTESLYYHPFNPGGSVFSPSGDALYFLDASAGLVFKVRTSDWSVVGGYPVGSAVHPRGSGFGNEVLLSPDGRFLSVLGSGGVQIIDLSIAISEAGTSGNDTLIGDGGANYLYGFAGDDILDGAGNPTSLEGDVMYGGTGNDTYYIDASNDLAIEDGYSDGYDTVYSSISYGLPGGIERLILTGSARFGSGSGTVIGNDLDNGLAGYIGNDVLIGNGGNDTLQGHGGIDEMRGGPGDDTYEMDSAEDLVIELPSEGNDTIYVSFDYTLPDNFENLILTVYGGRHGIGNAADNRLIGDRLDDHLEGRGGNDFLDGGAGANILEGGQGDDIYIVNNTSETLVELANEGIDEVRTNLASYTLGNNFENLRGTRTTGQQLAGNALNNAIWGGNGHDVLTGGSGSDMLLGGNGADIFSGGAGNDFIDGGGHTGGGQYDGDVAAYSGNASDYWATLNSATGVVTIVDLRAGSPDGTDELTNIEILKFANSTSTVTAVLAGQASANPVPTAPPTGNIGPILALPGLPTPTPTPTPTPPPAPTPAPTPTPTPAPPPAPTPAPTPAPAPPSTTVQLADERPSEVRFSPDGDRLYVADTDGYLRVYDTHTHTLLNEWKIGQKLGGMDISPDGKFLVVIDRNVSTTYKVDALTGAKTSYPYATEGYLGLLFDVAVLSDGTALFSQDFNGSGWTALRVLNFATGTYANGPQITQSAVLTRSATGAEVLIGEPNHSGAPVDIYRTGTGIVATTGAGGYNWGIQAYSGSLAAQYIYNEGIHIYDGSLQRKITLTGWNNGAVTDLAFSKDGAWLYVLENVNDTIVKISTADWSTVATIPVGSDVGGWMGMVGASNGSRLILDPHEQVFSVVTDSRLILVDNPYAPPEPPPGSGGTGGGPPPPATPPGTSPFPDLTLPGLLVPDLPAGPPNPVPPPPATPPANPPSSNPPPPSTPPANPPSPGYPPSAPPDIFGTVILDGIVLGVPRSYASEPLGDWALMNVVI